MIILLIVLALFGFTLAGTGTGSSSSSSGTRIVPSVQQSTATRKVCARPGGRAESGQAAAKRRCRRYVPVRP